jgi:hypothetical protein
MTTGLASRDIIFSRRLDIDSSRAFAGALAQITSVAKGDVQFSRHRRVWNHASHALRSVHVFKPSVQIARLNIPVRRAHEQAEHITRSFDERILRRISCEL